MREGADEVVRVVVAAGPSVVLKGTAYLPLAEEFAEVAVACVRRRGQFLRGDVSPRDPTPVVEPGPERCYVVDCFPTQPPRGDLVSQPGGTRLLDSSVLSRAKAGDYRPRFAIQGGCRRPRTRIARQRRVTVWNGRVDECG